MLLLLVISLYTSRLVLKELGITDYGIYNVIGGLITIFSFINGSMAQASQRYITYEVGSGSIYDIRKVFSSCIIIHAALAALIVVLGETIGLWYVYNVAVIPSDRFNAALWVYQCSIVVSVASVISVPYNALLIAHEKMTAFAYITIIEAVAKLIIVWILIVQPFDRLIVYGVLMASLSIMMRIIYGVYCEKTFPGAKLIRKFDFPLVKQMGKFMGWSLLGSVSAVGYTQGLNLLINYFFNPAVNAARGIAVTVQSVVRNFSGNFQIAVNPQITKSYASGDIAYLYNLIYRASLFSFFLFFVIGLPVFLEIDTLLSLWLVDVPPYTAIFIRILLIISSIELLASPLNVSAQATGNIRNYEITVSVILLLIVPLSYFVLKIDTKPQNVFWVFLFQVIVAQAARLFLTKYLVGLSLTEYIKRVLLKIIIVGAISVTVPIFLHYVIADTILRLVAVTLGCLSFTPGILFLLGLDKNEKGIIVNHIKKFIKK